MVEFAIVMLVILLFVLGLVGGLSLVDREKKKAPEDQLAGRFARGEIGEGEYLRSLAILRYGPELERYGAELEPPRLTVQSGSGRRGPAILRSSRRRVTPVASRTPSSGSRYFLVVPSASRISATVTPSGRSRSRPATTLAA